MLYLSIMTVTRGGAGGGVPKVSSISDAQRTKAHIPTSPHMYVQYHAESSERALGGFSSVGCRPKESERTRGKRAVSAASVPGGV